MTQGDSAATDPYEGVPLILHRCPNCGRVFDSPSLCMEDPYIVAWREVEPDEDYWTLTGDFEAVQHYSTKHQAHYDITEMEVKS